MKDREKAKEELLEELSELRQQLSESKVSADEHHRGKEEARQWDAMISSISDPISYVDRSYIYRAVNQAYAQYAKIPREQIIGLSIAQLLGTEVFGNQVKPHMDHCFSGETVRYQAWFDVPNEEPKFMDVTYNPVFDQNQSVVGAVVSSRDITGHKQAEEMLKETMTRYRELADSIADVFFALDKDLRYTYWNKASERLTGIPAKDALIKSLTDLFPETPQTRKAKRLYLGVLRTQTPQTLTIEYRLQNKDFFFEISAYPSKYGLSVFVRDVTDRMQTENRLLQSQQEFRAIAENVPGLFSYVDRNGCYRFVNRRYKEWFGLLRSEIIGRHYRSVVGEAAYELAKHYVEKVLSGHRVHYEERLPYAKGGMRWVRAEYIPDADERGKVKGFFALVTDITERKTAEEILRESEARYRAVVEQSADGIFLEDVTTRTLMEANPAFRQLLGYSQEEIGHLSIYDIVAAEPGDMDRRFHDLLQLEKGLSFTHERRYRRKDGSLLDVWLSSQVISYGGKQVVCTLVRDLTDRKRAEEALRASEEKFRTLFESSRDAIYVNTPEGRFLDINQAGLELLGYSKEEILRLNVREVYADPDDRARFQGEMDKEGFVKDREIKLRDKNGKAMHCTVTAILRRTADGRPLEYQGIIRDVGDFKQAEDQLRRSREQLRALSSRMERIREEERTRISREIHDELGQQLTGLRMDLSWLTRRLRTHEEPLIERSKAMLGLIDAIIQTVRKISTELRPGILDDLGLAAAAEWQAFDFEKRTGISCEFRSILGESGLDPGLCTAAFRILQEALTNVARHADATKVRVGLRKKGDKLIVEVKDNGRGITEEEITHARSLGLLGMRERALAFGGNLKITSAPNKGTRLILSLPLVKGEP